MDNHDKPLASERLRYFWTLDPVCDGPSNESAYEWLTAMANGRIIAPPLGKLTGPYLPIPSDTLDSGGEQ